MRKKDIDNTYKNNPSDFSEHLNNETGCYKKTQDGDLQSLNKDFVQISDRFLDYISELSLVNPVATSILFLFIKMMENNNTYVVSNDELSKTLKKSKDTIKRGIKTLKEMNFVVVYMRLNVGTMYFINPLIVCRCSSSYKQILANEYLKINNTKYKIDKELLDVEQLIKKDRIVLKSDEKRQLDKLSKPDNVKIKGMIEIFDWLKGKSQPEILLLIDILKGNVSLIDYFSKQENDGEKFLQLLDDSSNFENIKKADFIKGFDDEERDKIHNYACDIQLPRVIKIKKNKDITEEDRLYDLYVQEENNKKYEEEQRIFDSILSNVDIEEYLKLQEEQNYCKHEIIRIYESSIIFDTIAPNQACK